MSSAALAIKDPYDEVPVSAIELLEANVASIRVDVNELKTDFRAAVARVDSDIRNAVSKLETEIRAMAAKAERDLQQFANRIETQLAELRADNKSLREKVDKNFERLSTKIDETNKALGETNKALSDLSKTVVKIESRLAALLWVTSGLAAFLTLAITVGKAFKWF